MQDHLHNLLQEFLRRRLGTCLVRDIRTKRETTYGGVEAFSYEVTLVFPGNGWIPIVENDDPNNTTAYDEARLKKALEKAAEELNDA